MRPGGSKSNSMKAHARHPTTRRKFLGLSIGAAAVALAPHVRGEDDGRTQPATRPVEPIIDIHQHTHYHDRTDEQLLFHQQRMGVTHTILLPAGRPLQRASTDMGRSNGLAAQCEGNDSCVKIARDHPGAYYFMANEVPDIPEARAEIEKYLGMGGLGIGELKFHLDCDSDPM